jgi:nifR3 family TIM-barrel protein
MPKLSLAPVAGFTNAAFRLLASNGGADLTYTEMVSAAGLAHGSSPTRHLLCVMPGEGKVACQIFGSQKNEVAFAAREISALGRFCEINLNAGCPVPRIVREGSGSALVKKPELVHDLLAAMVAESNIPVTLKTRPGPHPDRVLMLELLDAAQTAGAAGVVLHARFTSQNHGGEVHLDLLSELVEKSRIPVTGNGGVVDDATFNAMADTGVAGIMIGRAALGNPWIFNELKGKGGSSLLPVEKCRVHLRHLLELRDLIAREFPADRLPSADVWASTAIRTHLFRYFSGVPGAGELRRKLNIVRTLEEINEVLHSLQI